MAATTLPAIDTGPDPLRTALRLDGWGTGVFGAFMLAAAPVLREPLGMPTAWSAPFGVAMLGGAVALLLIAGYPAIPTRPAVTVVIVNALSAVTLTILAFTDVLSLTAWGSAFLLIGAAVVALFATAEYLGLHKDR
ncbi:hypothetical protein [Nocardia crassostreae]|uniref:hypothetical protein n=1 Tax=Nocardia crassostreae TaxID=53428 RepID=UPI0008300BAE|nr:hypothetical protein [Nocardia crassostreae]